MARIGRCVFCVGPYVVELTGGSAVTMHSREPCHGSLRLSRFSGPCVCEKKFFAHHPCLETAEKWSQTALRRRKRRCGRRRRNTQAATAAAGVSTPDQLEGLTSGSIRGCWTLSTP